MGNQLVNCAICNQDHTIALQKAKSLYSEDMFDIVSCKHCNLVYVNPRQNWGKKRLILESMIADTSFHDKSDRDKYIYESILNYVETYQKPSRILDVGCSTGRLLSEAKKRGWDVYGVELNRSCADYCKNKESINIFQGETFESNFPDNYFDVIVMVHSIEHLYNLRDDIKKINKMLKPSGLIYIMTPNFDNYLIKIFKMLKIVPNETDALDPTGHTYMFTAGSMSKLLASNGFKIKNISAGISGNFLFRNRKNIFMHVIFKPLIRLIGMLNGGSTLTVLAEKV